MDLEKAIRKAYKTAQNRDWSKIYVMLDVHDTIASSTYRDDEVTFYPEAIEALRKLSKFPEIKLVLWTSCYPERYEYFINKLGALGIKIAYVNETPIKNTATGDFGKKPYFSIIIDDKAGFDYREWDEVAQLFGSIREEIPLKTEAPIPEVELCKRYFLGYREAANELEANRLRSECAGIWDRLSSEERESIAKWAIDLSSL
jgi:hypothetical protein